MFPIQEKLASVSRELRLVPVEKDKAVGDICGSPATMTVIGVQPLSLFFAFRVAPPDGAATWPQPDWLPELPIEPGSVSFEEGIVWLSLDDVSDESSEAIAQAVRDFADELQANGAAVPAGCLRCGATADTQLMYVDGKATRVCLACLSQAAEEKHQQEQALNRSGVGPVLSLPLLLGLAAVGWALFWWGTAALCQHLEITTVELHEYTTLLIIVVFAGVGCAIGWPMGKVFRMAAGNAQRTKAWAVLTTAAVVVLGEITEVLIHVFRLAGVLDPGAAIALVVPFIAGYTGLWWGCKIITAAAMAFTFYHAAARKTVSMQV